MLREREAQKKRLKEIILKFSYEKRKVTLASGRSSDFYFDGKQTSLHPEGAFLLGELMWKIIQEHFPQTGAVGGPTLGADPLATAVSLISYQHGFGVPAFIVRKAPKGHGTGRWIEGNKHLRPGMRVVLLEDVVTTGGSIIKAAQQVREAGLVPVGVVVLVDRQEGGAENLQAAGLPLVSLFTKEELLR